jgi:hypothetical protein
MMTEQEWKELEHLYVERENMGLPIFPSPIVFAAYLELKERREDARPFQMQEGPPIPWSLARAIYAGYSAIFGGDQSIERISERGGFGWGEVAELWSSTVHRDRFRAAITAAKERRRAPSAPPVLQVVEKSGGE